MSTSPDCSAVKRCCDVVGTYLTFSESPKIAAAVARQTSTSRPLHLPLSSCWAKPATPVLMPQIRLPRALTASRSLPAMALPETSIAASAAAAVNVYLRITKSPVAAPLYSGQHVGTSASVVAGERALGPEQAALR